MEKLTVGQAEKKTQKRIVNLFKDRIGYYYLGNWEDRENSNIEEEYLKKFLKKQGYEEGIIKRALFEFKRIASNQNISIIR